MTNPLDESKEATQFRSASVVLDRYGGPHRLRANGVALRLRDPNSSVFARSTYVYVTDAASPMFQRFELLFANKTVPRDSYRLETICPGSAGFQPAFFSFRRAGNFGSPCILAGDFAGNSVGWM
jgi:hypothetical protein